MLSRAVLQMAMRLWGADLFLQQELNSMLVGE